MPDVVERPFVLLRRTVFRVDFDGWSNSGIEEVEVRASPTLLISKMVGNDRRVRLTRVVLKIAHVIEVAERPIVVRVIDAVITEETGVPFVGQERNELARLVARGGHFLNSRPLLPSGREAIDPLLLGAIGHGLHIVPLRMRSESEEIQMAFGDVVGSLQRTLGVSDGIVVVKVAPKQLDSLAGG